jgi:hypothetical protein
MKPQRSIITKEYENKPFILTAQKLARIVEIANERMTRIQDNIKSAEEFKVRLTNGKEFTLTSLNEVLSLDNSKKNPIKKLELSLLVMDGREQVNTIEISFNDNEPRWKPSIQISASANDITWLQETVGALEEQVERTIPNDLVYDIRRMSTLDIIFPLLIVLSLVLAFATLTMEDKLGNFNISEVKEISLKKIADGAKTDSEKLDFIYQYLAAAVQPKPSKLSKINSYFSNYRSYLVGIPILIAIISAIAAFRWCYPLRVFIWGDYEEHYNNLVERRRFIWNSVIVALFIGILGSLFSSGITMNMTSKVE